MRQPFQRRSACELDWVYFSTEGTVRGAEKKKLLIQ
jgi:hypothetical protein